MGTGVIILGLHFGHDGSACVVKHGRLSAAMASERLCGVRKSLGITSELIDYVCSSAEIGIDDIEVVALSDYHPIYTHGACEVYLPGHKTIAECAWNGIFLNETRNYEVKLRGREIPAFHVAHHMCHCAASYYTSPFQEAACFSMDASGGDLDSIGMTALGKGNKIVAMTDEVCCVGQAYNSFVEWLGLGPGIYKAGSLMAWASFAEPFDHVMRDLDRHASEALFIKDKRRDYRSWIAKLWEEIARRQHFEPWHYDFESGKQIAASIQAVFEAATLRALSRIPIDTENLCLGGGSFLNCCTNSRVLRESNFRNLHLFPAATDDGCSVGAALYVAHHIMGDPRFDYAPRHLVYLGQPIDSMPVDHERVADCIASGEVVAWVHGRSEFGPRALGARSLLADPRRPNLREVINDSGLKRREWFRPVCPSVLAENSAQWFDHPVPSPFMLFTAKAKAKDQVPGIVHVDDTARHQDVFLSESEDFHRVIEAFAAKTGVPVLANTSLNGPGEPIIESRRDARDYFLSHTSVKMMCLHGQIEER